MRQLRTIVSALAITVLATALAGRPGHIESPPEGISPREFASDYSGCLGSLRSSLARDPGFTAEFNPGKHQGTVGEEEFLKALSAGIEDDEDLRSFCGTFE